MTYGKTIAQRLAGGFGVVLGSLGLLVLVTLISAFTVRSANGSMKQVVDATTNMEEIRGLMLQNQNSLTNYLLSGDAREVEKLNTGLNTVSDEAQKFAEATDSADW